MADLTLLEHPAIPKTTTDPKLLRNIPDDPSPDFSIFRRFLHTAKKQLPENWRNLIPHPQKHRFGSRMPRNRFSPYQGWTCLLKTLHIALSGHTLPLCRPRSGLLGQFPQRGRRKLQTIPRRISKIDRKTPSRPLDLRLDFHIRRFQSIPPTVNFVIRHPKRGMTRTLSPVARKIRSRRCLGRIRIEQQEHRIATTKKTMSTGNLRIKLQPNHVGIKSLSCLQLIHTQTRFENSTRPHNILQLRTMYSSVQSYYNTP